MLRLRVLLAGLFAGELLSSLIVLMMLCLPGNVVTTLCQQAAGILPGSAGCDAPEAAADVFQLANAASFALCGKH